MTREEAQRHFDLFARAAVLPDGLRWLWADHVVGDLGVGNELFSGSGDTMLRVGVGFLWDELDAMTPEDVAVLFRVRVLNAKKALDAFYPV